MDTPNDKLFLDNRFLADLIFKPDYSGLKLTPQLSQLLLAKIEEILETGTAVEETPKSGE